MENWKIINEYPTYSCSNLGNIKNNETNKFFSLNKRNSGYIEIKLFNKNENKYKNKKVHRLIAQTWIPNPYNKPTVNHLNKIRHDNRVENLEWSTLKEQSDHSTKFNKINNIIINPNNGRSIWKCDLITKDKIKYYKNVKDAALDIDNNYNKNIMTNISACALGKTKSSHGYYWLYDGIFDETKQQNENWQLITKYNFNEYYISDHGKIRNKNRFLKPSKDDEGYLRVDINKKLKRVNILVAKQFIPNPNNYPVVNHVDGDKENNIYTNYIL